MGQLRTVSVRYKFWGFVQDCHKHEVRLLFYIHHVLLVTNNWVMQWSGPSMPPNQGRLVRGNQRVRRRVVALFAGLNQCERVIV